MENENKHIIGEDGEIKPLLMFQEPKSTWKCTCDGRDKNDWIVEIYSDKAKIICNWCGKVVAEPDIFISKHVDLTTNGIKVTFHQK